MDIWIVILLLQYKLVTFHIEIRMFYFTTIILAPLINAADFLNEVVL